MINKLYEIIKNILSFLKNILVKILNSRIITIIDIILIILIFVSLFVELPYGVYMPGGATSVISHLDNVKYKTKGDIATTHVSYIGGDILSIIGGIFMPDWDIIKTDDIKYSHEDLIDAEKRGRIEMFSSASVATVIAYEKANVELNITSEDYYVTFITEEANTNLKVGDKILKFNGEDYDPVKVASHIQSLNPGDEIKLIVKRDDKEVLTTSKIVLIEEQKFIGIVITTIKNFDKKNIVTFSPEKNESGPSGGLMLSLGIYNSITEKDITNGKKICGTGTIDYDGTVGEISGVKYKIMGANKDKCDIFLVPTENYEEAKNTKDKFKYDIEIKSVKTFDDALAYLTK